MCVGKVDGIGMGIGWAGKIVSGSGRDEVVGKGMEVGRAAGI